MFTFQNIDFYTGSINKIISNTCRRIDAGKHGYICVTNVHGVVKSSSDKNFLKILNSSLLTVPDGMPLVWLARLSGYKTASRIYGPDLFLQMCETSERKKYRIFLYGTTKKTLQRLNNRLLRRYPKLLIVGTYAPPFRNLTWSEELEIRQIINKVQPHIVWVGLSTPKQEQWMYQNVNYLKANILIGVGAAFDFFAGNIPQAPKWIQDSGFEWSYRLLQEPKRLWKRYLLSYPRFLWYAVAYLLRRI